MEIAIAIAAAIALGVIGYVMGRAGGRGEGLAEGLSRGREEADTRLRAVVDDVASGRAPSAQAGTAEADLSRALEAGWAPRESERAAALREAIGRVSTFLDTRVRSPLAAAGDAAGPNELKEGIAHALGALEDLDFFLTDAGEAREGTDLAALARSVSSEFAADHETGVRLLLAPDPVRAEVNPQALMDALYLVLHNAGRFATGTTIDLTVEREDGRARILVRDRGLGFTEEAFARAFDPFYSTSDEGLGLGLPHARKLVEAMGGQIGLRNVPGGGAEVAMSFPGA